MDGWKRLGGVPIVYALESPCGTSITGGQQPAEVSYSHRTLTFPPFLSHGGTTGLDALGGYRPSSVPLQPHRCSDQLAGQPALLVIAFSFT